MLVLTFKQPLTMNFLYNVKRTLNTLNCENKLPNLNCFTVKKTVELLISRETSSKRSWTDIRIK